MGEPTIIKAVHTALVREGYDAALYDITGMEIEHYVEMLLDGTPPPQEYRQRFMAGIAKLRGMN